MIDTVLNSFIPNFNLSVLMLIAITFFLAGIVKGFLGMGLPATAIAILTLVIDPKEAIALLVLPIIATNAVQFMHSPKIKSTVRNFKYIATANVISIFIVSSSINSFPEYFVTMAIGCSMVVFSVNTLIGFRLPMGPGVMWQLLVGTAAGFLGGISSIWSPPIVMYLISRNVPKEQLIGAIGFIFLVTSFPLAIGYALAGILTFEILMKSVIGLLVSLAGFRVGELLRRKVAQDTFRKVLLWAFLALGVRLIGTGIF